MTASDLPQALLDAADVSAITQLVLTERECRDLGRWDEMRRCFFADSQVRLSWFTGSGPDFVTGSIDMARRGMLAKHRLGPVRVQRNGDRALASFVGAIDIPATIDGVDLMLTSLARFLYRAARRDERWGLSGFDAIYLRDELHAVVPGQVVPVTPAQVAGFRPAYRMLSFVLARQGYVVNAELPGEDQPQRAAALYRELHEWVGLPD
jgi:SnoaL-like domain